MGFLSKILGSGISDAVSSVANVVDQFMETPDEKRSAEIVMRKLQLKPDEFQVGINKIQAAHRSLFIAGPRPFMMWVCGFGFACHFIIFPIAEWIATLTGNPVPMPDIDTGALISIAMALLGLGGLRSWEKSRGLTK